MKLTICFKGTARENKIITDIRNLIVRNYNEKVCFNYVTDNDDELLFTVRFSDLNYYFIW